MGREEMTMTMTAVAPEMRHEMKRVLRILDALGYLRWDGGLARYADAETVLRALFHLEDVKVPYDFFTDLIEEVTEE